MIRVISLGAGVQSSAMLLMALDGQFGEMPDCAVFADTGWEPKATYEWLDQLGEIVAPFPIHRVQGGDIREEAVRGGPRDRHDGRPFVTLPVYSATRTGWGQGRRQCSKEYKITPVQKFVRENYGEAEMWIGISTDEAHRAKPSRAKCIRNRYPLLDAGISRAACLEYLRGHGYAVPKSSCIGCPFKGDADWARLRRDAPQEFAEAVAFDEGIRALDPEADQYLHRSMRPLGSIVEFNHETQGRMFLDQFGEECEGVCGL